MLSNKTLSALKRANQLPTTHLSLTSKPINQMISKGTFKQKTKHAQ